MTDEVAFDPGKHQVWPFKGQPGFRRSIGTAGTVAAPLLAGFSFTFLVLLLPRLHDQTTTVKSASRVQLVQESHAFSAAPELAALLLLVAGLLFVSSVQAAIAMRYHDHSPSELQEWYPQFFPKVSEHASATPNLDDMKGWRTDRAAPISVGEQWYGGWPREWLYDELLVANRWAERARRLYHAAILALLIGLTLLVLPPSGDGSTERWLMFAFAAAGALGEVFWIWVFRSSDS